MKTIDEIKNEVAVENSYKNWLELCNHFQYQDIWNDDFNKHLDKIVLEYAKQVAEAQREAYEEHLKKDWYERPDKCPLVTDNI